MRPEHLKELSGVRNRSVGSKVWKAVGDLVTRAFNGDLPGAAGWLRESRLVFLKKPGKEEPRPIRVGEVWRRLIGKRLLDTHKDTVQRFCGEARQYGIGVLNGAEILIHARTLIERNLAATVDEPVAVIDVDLRNAFPTLEWRAIREAVAGVVPGVGPWTEWLHQTPGTVHLASGEAVEIDRGAEQGDPLGGLYCAAVLAPVAGTAAAAVGDTGGWVWDAWYMDDGQVVLPARCVETYLRAFDAAAASVGATRVAGGVAKTTVRALGGHGGAGALAWATEYVRATACVITVGADAIRRLGVDIGAGSASAEFARIVEKLSETHAALRSLGDARAELVLQRVSLDVCRVTHLLRARGGEVEASVLSKFDALQKATLERTLGRGDW